jgi:hypothetical protein
MDPQNGLSTSGQKRKLEDNDDQEMPAATRTKVLSTAALEHAHATSSKGNTFLHHSQIVFLQITDNFHHEYCVTKESMLVVKEQ